jgi:AcrR family transcriptional regulator
MPLRPARFLFRPWWSFCPLQCFWSRGYEATSIRDLAAKMGITGASLYNAFSDKRSLYRRALDHYVEQSFGDRVGRFEGLAPRQAIGAFFDEIIERSLSDEQRKGCMLVKWRRTTQSFSESSPRSSFRLRVFFDAVRQLAKRTERLRPGSLPKIWRASC